MWNENGLMFTTTIGMPIDLRDVCHYMSRLCEDAGLGRWTPHELRYSAASLMLAAGVQLEVVSNILGHSSIRMTADTDGHIRTPQRQAVAGAMAGVLWGDC